MNEDALRFPQVALKSTRHHRNTYPCHRIGLNNMYSWPQDSQIKYPIPSDFTKHSHPVGSDTLSGSLGSRVDRVLEVLVDDHLRLVVLVEALVVRLLLFCPNKTKPVSYTNTRNLQVQRDGLDELTHFSCN